VALPVDDGGELWPILEREDVGTLILDLNMPGVNGWEVLRRLRTDYRSRGIRVPHRIGSERRESQEFALSLGADGFFSKPIDLQELTAALGRRAAARRSREGEDLT